MKVEAVKGYECPLCGEVFLTEDLPKPITYYQCGECAEVYEDKDDAQKCCKRDA